MDLPSRLDLYAIGRDYVTQRATKIDPGQVDVLGSDVNIFVGSQSCVSDTLVKQLGYSVARLYLDGCEGDDIDRYAFDRYGGDITRKGASPALGSVTFTRLTLTGGVGSIPNGTRLTTLTGVEYITTTDANFGSGTLSSKASVRAVQAGKATQVGQNAIRKFSKPSEIFDRTISLTNPLATAGGEDVEDDDTFKSRIRDFWRIARRGILSAIEFGAKTVPGVVSAQAIEALTATAQPARVVNLYIADSSGVASVELGKLVTTALLDFRAAGIAVILSTSIPQIVSVVLALSFRAGVDTVTLSNLVAAAVVEYINSLPVNGTLLINDLGAILARFKDDGLITNQNSIVSPVGDLVPGIGQTLRATIANVSFTSPSS